LAKFSIVGTSDTRNRYCTSIAGPVRLELSVIGAMASKNADQGASPSDPKG
jgi:hypothetical protein